MREPALQPLWVRDRWTHTVGSGACIQCLTLDTRHASSTLAYTRHANSHTAASGASVRCVFSTNTLSNRELFKTKFDSLDLRTFSKLPSARFIWCAPHLNLKPCLGQATGSMPPLIVRLKEKQSPKLLYVPLNSKWHLDLVKY